MSLRKIIRENIENITGTDQLFDIDGFEFVNKKTDKNNNILWKYSKSIKSGTSNRKDSDYTFNVFIAKTPNKNWYYKFFVYWKTHTSDSTSGKGKDFDLQFGPFDSLEAVENNLMHNLNHNILYSFNNYKDNNKIQLDNEIFTMVERVREVYDKLKSCSDSYFDDLKKELPNLFKEKSEVQLYIDDSYPDEDDKQQLLLMLSKIGSLDNLKEIESIKSIF
jgi:hypothetical protein